MLRGHLQNLSYAASEKAGTVLRGNRYTILIILSWEDFLAALQLFRKRGDCLLDKVLPNAVERMLQQRSDCG